ncbi:hypothetical protein BD310DRAFT_998891 [Dichomitus squalens]|uniref:Methyltransferase-domain-containing protein n=1 Tax=Dichomitus squalens TaxID=114155 RepID=A0A4Q9PC34_9APHY|nr:hypothetical protein BD310DRAFT_998891 [Dichomitus squalens]
MSASLFDVLRAYGTLQPPKGIEKPDVPFAAAHEFLLKHLLLNPHFDDYPPSRQYQIKFWKWAIEWLESLMSDEARGPLIRFCTPPDSLDERMYTHHVELMSEEAIAKGAGSAGPTPSYMTYLWPSGDSASVGRPVYPGCASATLLESRTITEGGTTGLRTWSASLILGQHMLSHPELVKGKRVLELGCGSGFLGVVTGSIHASADEPSLWLTDMNESVLQRCKVNMRLFCNQSHTHPDLNFELLDWSDALSPRKRPALETFFRRARPDLVLGADLAYDPSIIPPLVNILAAALQSGDGGPGPTAYIAVTVRNEETHSDFLRQAKQLLSVEDTHTFTVAENIFTRTAELGQDASQAIRLYKFGRKP